jgi:hypothetical protein
MSIHFCSHVSRCYDYRSWKKVAFDVKFHGSSNRFRWLVLTREKRRVMTRFWNSGPESLIASKLGRAWRTGNHGETHRRGPNKTAGFFNQPPIRHNGAFYPTTHHESLPRRRSLRNSHRLQVIAAEVVQYWAHLVDQQGVNHVVMSACAYEAMEWPSPGLHVPSIHQHYNCFVLHIGRFIDVIVWLCQTLKLLFFIKQLCLMKYLLAASCMSQTHLILTGIQTAALASFWNSQSYGDVN